MGDVYRGAVADNLVEFLIYFGLGNGVKACRWLVEDYEWSVLVKRPCNGYLLALTARNYYSFLVKILAQPCFYAVRELL